MECRKAAELLLILEIEQMEKHLQEENIKKKTKMGSKGRDHAYAGCQSTQHCTD